MATLEEIKTQLNLNDDQIKIVQAYADGRVTEGIKTFKSKNPTDDKMIARLEQIETAANQKIREAELKSYFTRKSLMAGLNPDDLTSLGIQYSDEKEIDNKLETYKKIKGDQNKQAINELLAKSSYQPGAGAGSDGAHGITRDSFNDMTDNERAALESSGQLDIIMKSWGL